MISIGEKIALLRKAKGMTQEQLAEKCSVTAQAVSKWENDLAAPDISLLPRLSELLGVSCDELLGVQRAEVVAVKKETVDFTKMMLRVRIHSADGDKVNLNLPLGIAEMFIKNGGFVFGDGDNNKLGALRGIDFGKILALVSEGAIGKLIDIDSEDGDKVEIWIE